MRHGDDVLEFDGHVVIFVRVRRESWFNEQRRYFSVDYERLVREQTGKCYEDTTRYYIIDDNIYDIIIWVYRVIILQHSLFKKLLMFLKILF